MKIDKKSLIKILTSFVLAIISYLIRNQYELVSILISLISYIIISYDIIFKAIKRLFRGEFLDENFLMTTATIGAIILGEYYEAIAVNLLYQIGEMFQEYAVNKSRKSISDLMNIKPDKASIIVDNKITQVKPEEVKIGDIIIVKAGEKIPLDGIVIEGNSSLDTKSITGESIPKDVSVNSEVISGCININGTLTIKVIKDYKNSTVSKILELIENATTRKTKTEKFITKFSKYYTPVVVILALLLSIIPPLLLDESFIVWINKALVFLVISCPCALVISVPLGFFSGIGAASKEGILFKGSSYMEKLINIDTIIFDKTGTLTKGNFKVSSVYTENIDEDELIRYVTLAEHLSNHPIARAINDYYKKEIDTTLVTNLEELSGYGIRCAIEGKNILVGNSKLMDKESINYKQIEEGTVLYIAIDGIFKGSILIEDEIKDDSATAINNLKKSGIKNLIMLTGDNEKTASKISGKLGLNRYYASLLPQDKVRLTGEIKESSTVMFVGDGINDAPSLFSADIGIAMGAIGSDAAIEASDIVLMNDSINSIYKAIIISKKTIKIVKQNIIFSIGVKILILILASLGFATMWEGIFADVGVSMIAILNSMRLLLKKK